MFANLRLHLQTLPSNNRANFSHYCHNMKGACEGGGTDVCEERRFSEEVGSAWSALVTNPETWLEAVQLSFWIKNTNKKIRYIILFGVAELKKLNQVSVCS